MARILPHREEIIPIKSDAYAPPQIPRGEDAPAAAPPAYAPPAPRARPREETFHEAPRDRHCPRCASAASLYYDLFQLRPSHVDREEAARHHVEAHPWVMGVFCGTCKTYLAILPVGQGGAPAAQAPPQIPVPAISPIPFGHR